MSPPKKTKNPLGSPTFRKGIIIHGYRIIIMSPVKLVRRHVMCIWPCISKTCRIGIAFDANIRVRFNRNRFVQTLAFEHCVPSVFHGLCLQKITFECIFFRFFNFITSIAFTVVVNFSRPPRSLRCPTKFFFWVILVRMPMGGCPTNPYITTGGGRLKLTTTVMLKKRKIL